MVNNTFEARVFMAPTVRISTAVVFTMLLTGCQAIAYGTASDLNQLKVGMTNEQVAATLGSPLSTEANADRREQRLIYKRMASATSWGPSYYDVLLRDGKVVEFGERR